MVLGGFGLKSGNPQLKLGRRNEHAESRKKVIYYGGERDYYETNSFHTHIFNLFALSRLLWS